MLQRMHLPARSMIMVCVLSVMLSGCTKPAGPAEETAPGHLFRATAKPVISSPIAYDWNGDGALEIAIGSWDGYLYLVDKELRDIGGWPKHSRRGYFSCPALADLDGDDAPEIVVGSDVGNVYAWRFDGQAVDGFPVRLGYRVWASPSILEDGHIAIAGRHEMLILDQHGHAVQGWPQGMPDWADATAAVGPDLVTVTTLTIGEKSRGSLCGWHLDGAPYPWSPLAWKMDSDSSPAIADINRDGRAEIIAGDDEGLLHVIDLDGREVPGFPQRAQSLIEGSPAIGDLDGDDYLDIVVGSWDGRVYVWNHQGEALPGWPIQVGDHVISSAALVDLDGDDRLDIVVGSKDTHVYGWTAEGKLLPGFPFALGAHVHSSPWVGDLEGDGRADIVIGANNGIHVLQNVGTVGRQAWPMFHRDTWRSGTVP
jgi:WD40 repeat protein